VVWRKDLQGLPFSAHPKLDASGNLWNIGTAGDKIIVWHINPQGALVKVQVGPSPYPGGMAHDVAVSERYIVLPLPAVKLQFGAPSDGPRRFVLDPNQPLRVLVMEKADISRRRVFELPAQMVFHVGNAYETSDGHVVLSYIGAPDAWFLNEGAVATMQGRASQSGEVHTNIVRMNMSSGRVEQQALDGAVEFPRMDPRRIGLPARWLLTGASWGASAKRPNALFHGLQLRDMDSGRTRRFDYGPQVVVEEHIFVPKPGKTGELDAWLLGTTFDAAQQTTLLNVLDAARLEDGPIAQASLPYVLPLGFHGNFTAA
jgi:all-trans-8'-apo-beta-carotenal 15,15'-oxygenase